MRYIPILNPETFANPDTVKHRFRVIAGPGSEGQMDAWEVQDGDFLTIAFCPTHELAAATAEAFRQITPAPKATEILTRNALRRDCR